MRKKVSLMLASAAFALSPGCADREDASINTSVEAARKRPEHLGDATLRPGPSPSPASRERANSRGWSGVLQYP